MPNPIKYSTGSESDALKKGNMYIGTGSVGKGPSDVTGYYQGPAVPSGGYVIYMNKVGAPGGLSYHSAANDAELISFTNSLAGQSYTTAQQCFDYYYGQNDKVLVNQDYPVDYPYIVMDGLVFYLDAGISQSYPGNGTTWTDINGLGPKNNGTLTNGPTYSTDGGGSIVFDGTDDYIDTNFSTNFSTSDFTINSWVYPEFDGVQYGRPIVTKNGNGGCGTYDFALEYGRSTNTFSFIMDGGTGSPQLYSSSKAKNNWYNVVATREFLGGTSYKCSIFINGVLNVTNTGYFTGGNGTKMTIGKFIDCDPVNEWLGKISIVSLYNRALSSTEILQNYNTQKERFGL